MSKAKSPQYSFICLTGCALELKGDVRIPAPSFKSLILPFRLVGLFKWLFSEWRLPVELMYGVMTVYRREAGIGLPLCPSVGRGGSEACLRRAGSGFRFVRGNERGARKILEPPRSPLLSESQRNAGALFRAFRHLADGRTSLAVLLRSLSPNTVTGRGRLGVLLQHPLK